jgi:hypothetical protein
MINYKDFDLSYIQNKAADAERISDLSKTPEGRNLIKQITAAEVGRLLNLTSIDDASSMMQSWRKNFTDLVRPNKFTSWFSFGNETLNLSRMVKSINLPIGERSILNFKRCGKSIKLPLVMDNPNSLSMTFYQDIDNKVFEEIIFLINNYTYDFVNYNDVDNRTINFPKLEVGYIVKMHTELKASDGFLKQFAQDLSKSAFSKVGGEFLGNTNYDLLNKIFMSGNETNVDQANQAKYFENIDVFKYLFSFEYSNIFVEKANDLSFDMEKMNMYQELTLNLQYQDLNINIYDFNLKDTETSVGEVINNSDFKEN